MIAQCSSSLSAPQCSSSSSAPLPQGIISGTLSVRNRIPAQNSLNSSALCSCPAAHSTATAADGPQRHHHHHHYRYSMSDDDSGCVLDEYGWVPPGVTPDIIHSYFAELPEHKVPYISSAGEQWRLEQMKRQLPAQDSDPLYCGYLSATETNELHAFAEARKKHCVGRGQILRLPYVGQKVYCYQCKEAINTDEVAISTSDNVEGGSPAVICWHPKCFVCVECKELLVDLIYFQHNQNVFCGRHHAEQIKPRCAGCDELIFSEECTEAEGRIWHIKHFVCGACGGALGGQRYIMGGAPNGAENTTLPLCIPCYEGDAQLRCDTCRTPVRADQPHIAQGKINWHADARCFCCCVCGENLLGKRYSFANRCLFCGLDATCTTTKSARLVLPPLDFASLIAPKALNNNVSSGDGKNMVEKIRRDAHLSTFSADATRQKPPPPQRFPRPPSLSPPPPPPSCPLPVIPSTNMATPNTMPSTAAACYTPPENIYETVMTVSASRATMKNSAPLLKTFSDIAIPVVQPHRANDESSPLRSASAIFSPPFSSPTASSSSSPSAASASSLQRRRLEMEERRRKNRRHEADLTTPFAQRNAVTTTKTIVDQNANYKQYCSQAFNCKNQTPALPENAGCLCVKNIDACDRSIINDMSCCGAYNESAVSNPALPINARCGWDKNMFNHKSDTVITNKMDNSDTNLRSSAQYKQTDNRTTISHNGIASRRQKHTKRDRSRRRFRSTCSLESIVSSCSSIATSSSTSSALSYEVASTATARKRSHKRHDYAIDYDSTSSGAEADLLAEYLSRAVLSSMRQSANSGKTEFNKMQPRARSADGRRQKRQRHQGQRSREAKISAPQRAGPKFGVRVSAPNATNELALREECTIATKANRAPCEQMRFQNFYSKMPPENIRAIHQRKTSVTRRNNQRRRNHFLRETKHTSLRSGYFSESTTSTSSANASDAEEERGPASDVHLAAAGFQAKIPLNVDSLKQRRLQMLGNFHRQPKQKRQHFRTYTLLNSQSSQDLELMNATGGATATSNAAAARFRSPKVNTAKLAKNKSNSNCIVS